MFLKEDYQDAMDYWTKDINMYVCFLRWNRNGIITHYFRKNNILYCFYIYFEADLNTTLRKRIVFYCNTSNTYLMKKIFSQNMEMCVFVEISMSFSISIISPQMCQDSFLFFFCHHLLFFFLLQRLFRYVRKKGNNYTKLSLKNRN